jgi:hypothetical protein
MDFPTLNQAEIDHIKDLLEEHCDDLTMSAGDMEYFLGLTREGVEVIRKAKPGYLDVNAWNETPAIDEMIATLEEVVSSFGGAYTLHGYAKYGFQARLTVEGFEYKGSEQGVGALVYKYRKADEVVIRTGDKAGTYERGLFVWWD